MREAIFSLVRDHLGADQRLRAGWLCGPLAHYILGPYQELEMGIAVRPAHFEDYVAGIEDDLRGLHPVVAIRLDRLATAAGAPFAAVTAVFDGGVILDLAIYSADQIKPQARPVVLLFRRGEITIERRETGPSELADTVFPFWTETIRTSQHIVRDDPFVAIQSLGTARSLLVSAWKLAHGSSAPSRLSMLDAPSPPEELWQELKRTVPVDVTQQRLSRALAALVEVFGQQVRPALRTVEFTYPESLEVTAINLVKSELSSWLA